MVKTDGTATRQILQVALGERATPVGTLVYHRQGRREHCAFAYDERWLRAPAAFNVSADLQWLPGHQPHKAPTPEDSVFHGVLADTAPDAWGRRVIARDHAKRRKQNPSLPPLTELDYLLAVDDFSRVGALRLRREGEQAWQRDAEAGGRRTPPLVELARVFQATRAVERGQESAEDLRYLQGKGTSLGGMRPKSTVIDEEGRLAIGKFPSVGDGRSVTRGEVLVMKLAAKAGIDTAPARLILLGGAGDQTPVALIRRFDRTAEGARIPYQSAASFLQASRQEDRAYDEIVDLIHAVSDDPGRDTAELWRRLVFNLLVTNVDDHLQNHGFLHVSNGHWRLAPAFDINPFPDKERESKTWLSEQDGPITELGMLMARAPVFGLSVEKAKAILKDVHRAVRAWRVVALSPEIGLRRDDLADFAPAFEHEQMHATEQVLGE